ncbi:hypothetical protein BN7_930 [Wickerhamomyces ciferrii]|uniref:Uncharacterized protein n=1 Tax=Wickerhamomyces ciferrii (strain ATCC 14091 / BCRC 22168 / CBS 111 / JCM 3599 / NBRC 0793 / NRRL Y-1031 F-60-10) TaxID=1206466 RepID=K0KIX4_WICCF|nr:uncharacterized protein BN7_930 [Wickerhamomyces ciferrii]CCH41389.1 hypothetical protein BN7_930 [Wickerhamomyces ciferrii]
MSNNPDDLDDGLDYQVDSEPEAEGVEIKEDESEDEIVKPSKKEETESKENQPTGKKRRKTDDKYKEKKRVKMEQDINTKKKIPQLNSTDLAHHFSQLLIKFNKDSTHLDYFKKSDFVDGSNYKETRNLDNFKDFTDKYNKGLTIILSISRVRIGDLYKALGPKSKAMKVGKGYESKVRDDTKYVLGTVEKMLNFDFGSHEVKSLILDTTYQDQKSHSILDEPKLTTLLKKYEGKKIILY